MNINSPPQCLCTPPSAAVTRLLPSNLNLVIQMPRMHGLIVSVRFNSDGAGADVLVILQSPRADIVDKVQTSLLQRGERRVTVEL